MPPLATLGVRRDHLAVSKVRCRAIVSGRVQGVFYRDSCQQMARRLGVRGSVRNRRDGTVEVVAEGERDAVDMRSSRPPR